MNRQSPIVVKKSDKLFPEHLRQIPDPPKVLYCRGNVELLLRPALAVVGTRKMTSYGSQAADAIVRHVVKTGFVVVSGLALGVDARAHRSALESQGATIAVLGSGINAITPTTNERLGRQILEQGGLIVSELPASTPADKWTFPKRNRIISGLSLGVVIIEADRESGSLITAQCALEQGRDVFAVPGSIFAPTSSGANHLISQGASPVLTPSDVTQDYVERGLIGRAAMNELPTLDDPAAQAIFAILKSDGPQHIDALAAGTQFDVAKIGGTLAVLELQGLVASDGRGTWMIKK